MEDTRFPFEPTPKENLRELQKEMLKAASKPPAPPPLCESPCVPCPYKKQCDALELQCCEEFQEWLKLKNGDMSGWLGEKEWPGYL